MPILFLDEMSGASTTTLPDHYPDIGPAWEPSGTINQFLPDRDLELNGNGEAIFETPASGVNQALNAARGISGAPTDTALLNVTFKALTVGADAANSSATVLIGNSFETTNEVTLLSDGIFAGIELFATNGATYDVAVSVWAQTPGTLSEYEGWTLVDVAANQLIEASLSYDKASGTATLTVDGVERVSIDVSAADPIVFSDVYVEARNSSEAAAPAWGIASIQVEATGAPDLSQVESYRYAADIETPGGSVRVPISSWQATLKTTESSWAQIVIPSAGANAEAIEEATEFAVSAIALSADGSVIGEVEIVRCAVGQVQYSRGPYRETVVVSGYLPGATATDSPSADDDKTISGVQMRFVSGGTIRYRCPLDPTMRPTFRLYTEDGTLQADSVSFYALLPQAYMDVTAVPFGP